MISFTGGELTAFGHQEALRLAEDEARQVNRRWDWLVTAPGYVRGVLTIEFDPKGTPFLVPVKR